MLTISNKDCKFLNLQSEAITDLILNPSKYSDIKITGYINNCTTPFTNECTPFNLDCVKSYTKILPNCCNLKIKYITFVNLIVNHEFNIEINRNINSCTDLFTTTQIIQSFINLNFLTNLTLNHNCNLFNNEFTWIIDGFPDYITIKNIVYELDGYELEESFIIQNQISFYITSDGILIDPLFFNSSLLNSGVYSIDVLLTTINGVEIKESNCFFVDCCIDCQITKNIETLDKDEKLTMLMLHYGLTSSSNCGCNCDELKLLYNQLNKLLTNDTNTNCSSC